MKEGTAKFLAPVGADNKIYETYVSGKHKNYIVKAADA